MTLRLPYVFPLLAVLLLAGCRTEDRPVTTAVIDATEVVTKCNDGIRVRAEIQQKFAQRRSALQKQEKTIATLRADPALSDPKSGKRAELEALARQFIADNQALRNDVHKEEAVRFTPILDKINKLLAEYAKEHGLISVQDKKGFAYIDPSIDITAEIIKRADKMTSADDRARAHVSTRDDGTPQASSKTARAEPGQGDNTSASSPSPSKTPGAGEHGTAAADSRREAVLAMVEAWRQAWEAGRLDDYLKFYAADAVQGERRGRDSIRAGKRDAWQGNRPKLVKLDNLVVTPTATGITVEGDMQYQGGNGRFEKGKKSLTLVPSGNGFLILTEQWTPQ